MEWILFALQSLISIKNFADLASLGLSESNTICLKEILLKFEGKERVLAMEVLQIIYRKETIDSFKQKHPLTKND